MSHLPALFDVNAGFGKICNNIPDCPTLRDRLRHMDRLGIGRAVVWNTEARTENSTLANRRLRLELARLPERSRRRLAPAFAISPLLRYERQGPENLRRDLVECRARCLRFAAVGGFKLGELEPLMAGLRDLRPIVIMDVNATDGPDILAFTDMFPEIALILGDVGWGSCQRAMDLMRRRPNILIETSLIHTWNGIGLLARHCGAQRVLFGAGRRALNGASIAALAHAELSDADRQLIAHGNLDRLLDVRTAPLPAGAGGAQGKGRLWQRLLERKPLGVDVVDAHAHLGASGGYVLEENDIEKQIPLLLAAMRRLGVNATIASGMQALFGGPIEGNDALEKLLAPRAGRLLGYLAFNPFYADAIARRLDRYFDGRVFVGFKLLCDYWHARVTDARFAPMWECANRRRLPVLIHTWEGQCNAPAMLNDLARKYPQATFILGHAGGGSAGRTEAEALAAAHPNVYLEWCGSFFAATPWESTIEKVGPGRVVFGTDAVLHSIPWELGRLLSLDVPDRELVPILGANMRRILRRAAHGQE